MAGACVCSTGRGPFRNEAAAIATLASCRPAMDDTPAQDGIPVTRRIARRIAGEASDADANGEAMDEAMNRVLDFTDDVAIALREGRPIVALESTIIAHGMPWPQNAETALA